MVSNMVPYIVIFLFCMVLPPAYGAGIEIVTGRGNVFLLDDSDAGIGDGTGDGTSMLDGIGINSRLVHYNNAGSMIHGSGLYGQEHSIRPYNDVDPHTDFAFAALESDDTQSVLLPEFYHGYLYTDGRLVQTSEDAPNVLGYQEARNISGSIQTSSDDGIGFEGAGRTILSMVNYQGQDIIITGILSEGTTIRIVESPYDLMGLAYDSRGFLINHCNCNPGIGTLQVLAGSVDDSAKSGIFAYEQSASASVYHGKCCKGRYLTSGQNDITVSSPLVIRSHPDGYLVVQGDTVTAQNMDISDIMRPGAKLFRLLHNTVGGFEHWIYDTLPVRELYSFSGTFEERITIPQGSYMVVDSAGGTSKTRGTILGERGFVDIAGLEPDTGYRIIRDGSTVVAGITTNTGTISVGSFENNAFSGQSGTLHLYENSTSYIHRDSEDIGQIVMDHFNGVTLSVPSPHDRIYSVHAYVKIPLVGAAEITGVSLDGTLGLGYLNGQYSDGQSIMVPVIPTYQSIHFTINGIETSLNIADVLGGTGLYIADPVSSSISLNRPDEFVHDVRSVTGTVTYMIATHDGLAKAHIRATVSGESEIANTRKYTGNPPPPPPPLPRDPLTTWVTVYVNGQIRTVNGEERTQIFFSDMPVEDHRAETTAFSWTHIARFAYPEITVFDTVSVPVNEADFVEFYFYNEIHAQGSIPPIPPGYTEYQRSGHATATAILEHASINTSM